MFQLMLTLQVFIWGIVIYFYFDIYFWWMFFVKYIIPILASTLISCLEWYGYNISNHNVKIFEILQFTLLLYLTHFSQCNISVPVKKAESLWFTDISRGGQDRNQSILETIILVWVPKSVPNNFHESKKYECVIVLEMYFSALDHWMYFNRS